MSVSRRVQRVEKELREIIGVYLLTGMKAPLSGVVTLTRVTVSPDLRIARAFVTMLASNEAELASNEVISGRSTSNRQAAENEKNQNLEILNSSTRDLQAIIHKQLPMKYCPKVRFEIDKGFDNVQIVEQRLREIKQGEDS